MWVVFLFCGKQRHFPLKRAAKRVSPAPRRAQLLQTLSYAAFHTSHSPRDPRIPGDILYVRFHSARRGMALP